MRQHGIYYETQRGGLCRLHSINHYFGKQYITDAEFAKHIEDYDKEYKEKYHHEASCKNWDVVSSNQKNIVSHILKINNIYTRYYAINQLYNKPVKRILDILKGDIFFIFNEGHIWNICRKNKRWYSVNSMGGVKLMRINNLTSQKNVGFIIPVDIVAEYKYNLKKIKDLFKNEEISAYLKKNNEEKNILGELEIPLGIVMDILETNLYMQKYDDPQFAPIRKNVNIYNEFLTKFTDGNYNDIDLILKYLTPLLTNIIGENS